MSKSKAIKQAPGRKTRVLFVIPTLRGGGAERVMVTLLKSLSRTRFELALAVVDMRGAVFAAELPDDVELVDLGCNRVRDAVPRIVALARARRPDVLFSTLGYLNLAIAMAKPLLPRGMRLVARETAIVSQGILDYPYPRLVKALYRMFYGSLDRIVCQSESMLADVAATFGVPHSKMVVINNPVDLARVRAAAQAPLAQNDWSAFPVRLVAIGRMNRVKGFDLLLEALALLNEPGVGLAILGAGSLEAELRAQAGHLGLSERVHFAGYQTNPYAWIARADAFVLSSRHEGFPNVVIEALACNRPIIATPAQGGTLEILRHYPAVVAREVSAPALASAIRTWLEQYEGEASAVDVSRYSTDAIAAAYAEVLEERA
ncbi:glycosyltransferase [Massilia sp.]|uniref:glycosyltransferase n=1 Tax=Massilia sp. TaxID=1882437 RepID=UPI00352C6F55